MDDYAKLIQDIKKVDRIAALKLAKEVPLLLQRKVIKEFSSYRPKNSWGRLDGIDWKTTREDFAYWNNLYWKLRGDN